MMGDLISRKWLVECVNEGWIKFDTEKDENRFIHLVRDIAPPAEPERKTGKWQITSAYPHNVYCSVCHKKFAQTHWAVWEDGSLPRDFCPNCGADMRGEHDE